MNEANKQKYDWRVTARLLVKPQVASLYFLGLSAGIPLALIFSSLSLWLNEAGVTKSTVTYFSWAALAFSFKFVWAPIIDSLPVPFLTRFLGRRRGWLLVAQFGVIAAIMLMSSIDPAMGEQSLYLMAWAAVLLGFSAATQDVVIDAYRIEVADVNIQALLSSTYVAGYRTAMVISGAGALYLADLWGTDKGHYRYEAWMLTYLFMAGVMLVGVLTTLVIREPAQQNGRVLKHTAIQYVRFFIFFLICVSLFVFSYLITSDYAVQLKQQLIDLLNNKALGNFIVEAFQLLLSAAISIIAGFFLIKAGVTDKDMVRESYWLPAADFFNRYGGRLAILLLVFIGFYRISDIVLGVVANVFYQDIGFTKTEIATVAKTFGLIMMIIGGFLGGVLSIRFGVMRILLVGAVLTVVTNLSFMWLAHAGHNIPLLYLVISADNLTAGLASTAFIAFLSSITNVSFTAVQYAIFSSLMSLIPKIIGGYSGSMVQNIGYSNFFLVASLMGVPVLYLIYLLNKHSRFKLES